MTDEPQFILHIQHGLSDTGELFRELARQLPLSGALLNVQDLDIAQTWLRIEPLLAQVERRAAQLLAEYPRASMRIIGHSMGGLIWIELLHQHPEWWPRTHSLVLLGSPIGGADLARIADPFGWGIGIARDLGINRRAIAERVATHVPTLVVAGDLDGGSDGVVTSDA
jgi:pimeloyl-ACP methyl ester carboxylesterase